MTAAEVLNIAALRREFVAGNELIPYEYHYSDKSIKTGDDALIRIFEVTGLLFETADNEQINAWHNQLCQALLGIGINAPKAAIWQWTLKEADHCNDTSSFEQKFSSDFLRAYAGEINKHTFYQTRIFVAVCVKSAYRLPKFGLGGKMAGAARAAGLQEAEEKLEEITAELKTLPHGISVLGTYEHEDTTYSSPLEVLFRILNGHWQPVPLYNAPINTFLAASRFLSGRDAFEIRTPTEQIYGAALGFRKYLDRTNPLTMQHLLSLPFPLLLAQSFTYEENNKSLSAVETQVRQMKLSQDAPKSYIQALEKAVEQVKATEIFFGHHHINLMVYVHNDGTLSTERVKRLLTERLSQASSALSRAGIIISREDIALPSAHYAALAANHRYRPRVARINSRNLAAFMPFHITPTGSDNSKWQTRDGRHEALLVFRNTSGGLYRFNPHINNLGHTILIGASRSGKTLLMGVKTSQLDKYGAREIVFDKDCGQEILIRALGGQYHNVVQGEPTGLNPYGALEPTERNITFLTEFSLRLAYPDGDHKAAQENELNHHLKNWYANTTLPPHLRRLSELRNGLQDIELKERLLRWTKDGAYGWLFDNPIDRFDIVNPQYVGIDTTDILDIPVAKTPFFMYLMQRVRESLDGRRTVIAVDELWKMLDDSYFEREIKDWLKTLAKKNAYLLGATQDAADVANSPISSTILSQCQSRIFYPNPLAKLEDYKPFSLTDNEFHFIKNANPADRMLLIKQELASVIVNFKLNNMDDFIAVISGLQNNLPIARQCIAEAGDNPRDWLPLYYDRYVKE